MNPTYLAEGERRYAEQPVTMSRRRVWELQCVWRGRIAATSPASADVEPRGPALWVHGPEAMHGWTGVPGRAAWVAVMQTTDPPAALLAGLPRDGAWVTALSGEQARRFRGVVREAMADDTHPSVAGRLRLERAALDGWLLALAFVSAWQGGRPTATDRPEQAAQRAMRWYHEHLAEGPGVEQVAAGVGLSASQLRRHFASAGWGSPHAALRSVQFQTATDLLAGTDWPVARVATACGFASASVFSRAFAQHHGKPPVAWRAAAQRRGAGE